ncbi:putative bifunctional diguanylate cyclase/phosphodiesterase [Modestobacter lapidis]|nr:EAL domain-containing protein [Modestobacter lapidis]
MRTPTRRALPSRLTRDVSRRLSAHAATGGLVVVLLVLTVFSVVTAVANADAAREVEQSAAVAEWSDQAEEGLDRQEELADELVLDPDQEVRSAYDAATAATRNALVQMGTAAGEHEGRFARSLVLHERYGAAVEDLLAAVWLDPAGAEEYEDTLVDPHHEALETLVKEEARQHLAAADTALESMARSQRLLLVATPLLFGVGLVLVGLFAVVLTRSRRATLAQAEENRRQALHDGLTGLPNRTLLAERATAALATTDGDPGPLALMLIDLDRFKEINDTLGHAYGDAVLRAVATRLQDTVRATDTVARLGGDEFAILLPAVAGAEAALELAARAQAAMEGSIEVDGVFLDVDASIGIALADGHGSDVDGLLQNADIAMYVAKERGLGVCVYDDALNDHSPERLGLLGDLRRAIDAGELVLHFQPKVAMPGSAVSGVEALVRWQHPQRGMIPPASFIPLAERTPLIRPLTRYVLSAALEQCARWRAAGRTLTVAVNISARNLLDERFVDDVTELLVRWQVPAGCLELELTESAIMADPDRAQEILTRLADVGITLSIDDFGAGYTSLAHLKGLPVHQLKIDRTFVAEMAADHRDADIVRSIVELGHNLGLTTVAEGIEDQVTWDRLSDLGCDVAQGYFMCRPLPADQLERWFDSVSAPAPA